MRPLLLALAIAGCGGPPTQWEAAHDLASLVCAGEPDAAACELAVVRGWCASEASCAAEVDPDALDACAATARPGYLDAGCWALFR